MTARNRIVRYLTSRRNLAGSALALAGAGLALADPVGLGGLVLVLGFYVVGVLAVPSRSAIRPYGYDPLQVERDLSDDAEILPRIACLPPGSQDLYLIERTARDWLPTAVERYLHLPGDYISSQPGSRGWSALQVLVDELDLLDAEMRRVAEVVHRADMDRLLAHRRFLSDRFRREEASG